jgi:thiamine biosynthesis protein ThiI
MISQDVVLVRYGEITLKDRWTRNSWERILAANLAFDLRKAGLEHRITRGEGRIFVHTSDPGAAQIAARTFGVVSTSPAETTIPDIQEISRAAVDLALKANPSSFAIRPRRSGGSLPSEEIGRAVGEAVRRCTGAAVDLTKPELEIFVEARQNNAYVLTEVVKGVTCPWGLGKDGGACIGGIDSPVAAWMMMRRGCPVTLLHFDSRPYADALSNPCEAQRFWRSGPQGGG